MKQNLRDLSAARASENLPNGPVVVTVLQLNHFLLVSEQFLSVAGVRSPFVVGPELAAQLVAVDLVADRYGDTRVRAGAVD